MRLWNVYQELLIWPMLPMLRQLLIACLVTHKLLNKDFFIHVHSCVQPAHSYYRQQLTSSLKVPLIAFKAAGSFLQKVHMLEPTLVMVSMLALFPFLKKLFGFKHELPHYLSTTVDLAESIDCLEW